jgi:hypothetical protein
VLLATCVQLLAVGLAPFVGALALGSGPPGRPALVLAGGVAAIALPLTLLLGRYQVATLAADAAFRRAQVAEPAADFVVAIRATQDAIALVPRQSEYYSLLGQYYGALAPRATGSELPDFVAAPATATSLRQPTQLSRDQVFDLGRVRRRSSLTRSTCASTPRSASSTATGTRRPARPRTSRRRRPSSRRLRA